MKVTAINPGQVWMHNGVWKFFIVFQNLRNKTTVQSGESFASANEAKQAMRERVALERKHNGLI